MQLKQKTSALLSQTGIGAALLNQAKSLRITALRTQRDFSRRIRGGEETKDRYRIFQLQAENRPTFFGYFDKTPFNANNTKVLAMAMTTPIDWQYESIKHPIEIGYFDWRQVSAGNPVFHKVGLTESWCWQQGCMLQWFPADPERFAFYNCFVDGQYGAVIQDISSKQIVRRLVTPIYAIHPDGKLGVSLNFSRLERLRPGYGYSNLPDPFGGIAAPDKDGIWLVDLVTGRSELVVSLRSLVEFFPLPSMQNASHYVNHLTFNPDGTKLVFLHLWQDDDDSANIRHNRLLMYDFAENQLSIVEDKGIVSHFSWLSNTELMATYFSKEKTFQYTIYDIGCKLNSASFRRHPSYLRHLPRSDGHPSPSPNHQWLVTDTYPDRHGDQHLRVISLHEDRSMDIGVFYSPLRYRGAVRCDLHPRWDRTGKRVCIDSTSTGVRSLVIVNLDEVL